ncbi:hypothetical protein [Methanospirillum hungatei]
MLIHPGSPPDSTNFKEIMDELRRRLIRNGDFLIFDKRYFSSKNDQIRVP